MFHTFCLVWKCVEGHLLEQQLVSLQKHLQLCGLNFPPLTECMKAVLFAQTIPSFWHVYAFSERSLNRSRRRRGKSLSWFSLTWTGDPALDGPNRARNRLRWWNPTSVATVAPSTTVSRTCSPLRHWQFRELIGVKKQIDWAKRDVRLLAGSICFIYRQYLFFGQKDLIPWLSLFTPSLPVTQIARFPQSIKAD